MIKANELRIGNLINWDTVDSPSYFEINHFKYLDRLRPIPLTEEWLVRFGFVKLNAWDDMLIYGLKNIDIEINNLGLFYDGFNINYVHQLQNLYFALTGEELNKRSQ